MEKKKESLKGPKCKCDGSKKGDDADRAENSRRDRRRGILKSDGGRTLWGQGVLTSGGV